MPGENTREARRANRQIKDLAKSIQSTMDSLYSRTYFTHPTYSRSLEDLNTRINDHIDRITNHNQDTVGMSSISKMYVRLGIDSAKGRGQNKATIVDKANSMFENSMLMDDLYGSFMSNRFLKELDDEIDSICTYFPDLLEALDTKKDNVLSADHFSKDFLTLKAVAMSDQASTDERAKQLKKRYNLINLVDEAYDNAARYGEQFIYVVPYRTAIGKLLGTKPDTLNTPNPLNHGKIGEGAILESVCDECIPNLYRVTFDGSGVTFQSATGERTTGRGSVLVEHTTIANNGSGLETTRTMMDNPLKGVDGSFSINLEFSTSNMIDTFVENARFTERKMAFISEASLCSLREQHIAGLSETKKDIQASGSLSFKGMELNKGLAGADGLVAPETGPKIVPVHAPGAVVQMLRREQVIPIYIDSTCLGYYYLELRQNSMSNENDFLGFKNMYGDPFSNMSGTGGNGIFNNIMDAQKQDDMLRYIAGQLSEKIDKNFVNSNQDLSKEIYMILKYNDLFNTPSMDTLKVTFVPPEDMYHIFFKQDPVTHRGISDLARCMIPAKIYVGLYTSGAIGKMTRGYDRRVFYIKQNVDTNIAQTMLTAIAQIKQGNFGLRQFQNINNILNIVGRFNDYFIPQGASGDYPIQIETMPGQQIEIDTDFLDKLKEMCVNSTGVPFDVINTRHSVDYATQLSMSSSKFLRVVYKRQDQFQPFLSDFVTRIYNYEYEENIEIEVSLPPPAFLNVTNMNQLIENTINQARSIAEAELANEQDEAVKNEYIWQLAVFYLGSQLDLSRHKDILDRVRIKMAAEKKDEE